MTQTISEVLHTKFIITTDFIKDKEKLKHLPLSPPHNVSLFLYSRAKQYEIGPCNTEQPSLFNITARLKWNAWSSCHSSKWRALHEYMDALRDYILTIDFSQLNEDGNQLAQGMLEAVTLDELQVNFLLSDGTAPDIYLDNTALPPTLSPELQPINTNIYETQSQECKQPSSPTISSKLTTPPQPQLQDFPVNVSTPPDVTEQPILNIPNATTPVKRSPTVSPTITTSSSTAQEFFSPQIRTGSRSARKSSSNKPYIHQSPAKYAPQQRFSQLHTPQPHSSSSSSKPSPYSYADQSQPHNFNNSQLQQQVSTEYATPIIATSTKEIFLQLQQHAQQTNNKQLLLLLALIDQRETATYLKLQNYKQQQIQHIDIIDSLQYQLQNQQEQQIPFSLSLYQLQEELSQVKISQQQQISPIVQSLETTNQKLQSLQSQFESFKSYVMEKLQWCTRLLDQKFPSGWLGVRKTFFNYVKFLLRCYTLWSALITVRDIYDWCQNSRWLYKRVFLPLSQHLK